MSFGQGIGEAFQAALVFALVTGAAAGAAIVALVWWAS